LTEKSEVVRCPKCGGRDVRHSHTRRMWDSFMAAFHRVPMRCRMCKGRFFVYERPDDEEEDTAPEAKTERTKAE
jgi:DNA-directed RNA polymerase subunit RPC12/RpoP